jgi:hypothetical protein
VKVHAELLKRFEVGGNSVRRMVWVFWLKAKQEIGRNEEFEKAVRFRKRSPRTIGQW